MAAKKASGVLPEQGPLAAQILERALPGGEVTIDRLEAELGAEARRYDIVAALKVLERAGAGRFIVGRRGRQGRFAWGDARDIRKLVRNSAKPGPAPADRGTQGSRKKRGGVKRSSVRAPAKATEVTEPRLLEHSFYIRPDVLTTWVLPEDVTQGEVERLCQFLQSLPFER